MQMNSLQAEHILIVILFLACLYSAFLHNKKNEVFTILILPETPQKKWNMKVYGE